MKIRQILGVGLILAMRGSLSLAHADTIVVGGGDPFTITFDENGDLRSRVISVFRITKDDKYPPDDVLHQYKYLGIAPQSS